MIFKDLLDKILSYPFVNFFQLRIKNESDENIINLIKAIKPICDKNKKPLILNDRPDLATSIKCAGVHIGPDDISYEEARTMVGKNAIVGFSCKGSKEIATEMTKKGADYVAFGAFYDSPTKKVKIKVNPEIIRAWKASENSPCVAIGGIKISNCAPIIEAGADFLAISSGIWQFSKGPLAAIEHFGEKLLAK
tara:strand:+ start:657 stop:1235 length:579 start_codon:yes stop_codon:yes gene_type:complete